MGAGYSHTSRPDGTTLTGQIYDFDHQNHIDNAIPSLFDDYSSNVSQMRSTVDPGEVGSESLATSLAGEIERIRFVIKEMKDGMGVGAVAQWYSSLANGLTVHSSTNWTLQLPWGLTLQSGQAFGSNMTNSQYQVTSFIQNYNNPFPATVYAVWGSPIATGGSEEVEHTMAIGPNNLSSYRVTFMRLFGSGTGESILWRWFALGK